jgi:hypothetical protein
MARLEEFDGDALAHAGEAIRRVAHEATTMEDAARRVVGFLYDDLLTADGGPALALARLYKTHPYARLPANLRDFARETLDHEPSDDVRCLTLLGTRGVRAEWDDRMQSSGHKAIPLPSVEFVHRLPMVAGLVQQLGLEIDDVVRPDPERIAELSRRTYGVFHVPDAVGSPFVPAQDFVVENRIRSALGFGGILFSGDFFAVVLFSTVAVSADVADRARILSLAVRVALMPFGSRVFDGQPGSR